MRAGLRWILILVAATSPALASADPVPTKGKLLILEPAATGIDGRVTLALTSALAEAAAKSSGRPVVTMLDLKDVLAHEETRILTSCDDEARCRQSLDKLAGVELLVGTTIGPVGQSLTITLALIDKATAVARARVSAVVEKQDALPEVARELAGQLFEGGKPSKQPQFSLGNKPISIAVFDLIASGVPEETATNLTQLLSAEVKQIPSTKVIARDDIRAVLNLEAQKQLLGCADSTSCLGEIGGALGVDLLLSGHVGRIAETHLVSLRLIDPSTLEVKSRVTESFVGPEDQLVGALRFAVKKLFGQDLSKPSQVAITAGQGAGSIFLDGTAAGAVGQPLDAIALGRHTLRIVDPDYLEWKGDVYIQPGMTELSVSLEERPRRWYQSWVFWTVVGGAAAIATGAAIGISSAGSTADTTHPFGFETSLPRR
ncbi:MAG: hypothetical protein U1E65_27730 [Myxococcota bacterium]